MKKRMKNKMKNRLDEMQEQKMLKIEHNGCWFAFWGLLASLLVQVAVYGQEQGTWKYVAGEWVVFMCLAVYIGIDCLRNGLWDRKIAPTPVSNMAASIIAGICVFIFNFYMSYKSYGKFWGAAATGVVMCIFAFVICFVVLSGCTFLYKKRVNNLEKDDTDTDKEIGGNE